MTCDFLKECFLDTYQLVQAEGGVGGEYEQVLYWKLTESALRLLWMQGFQLVLLVLMAMIYTRLAVGLGKLPAFGYLGWRELLFVLAGVAAVVVLHELVHGLAMSIFGARPQYGVLWKMLVFYATAPGYGFHRNAYVAVALAPLVVVSTLSMLGIWLLHGTSWVGMLALIGALNGAGAAGDLWMAGVVLSYPPQVYVVDERDGMRILRAIKG
jgi:hypothetical protein